jgi:serine/threonine protein kinase
MYCRQKTLTEQRKFDETSDPRYSVAPTTKKTKLSMEEDGGGMNGTNPLYTKKSNIIQQDQLEYDGVKLPEYPRSQIVYIRDLGQGHFGIVVQAEATNIEEGKEKSTVAIKVLKEGASPQFKKEFFREASLMCAFDHPNILKLLGVCIEMEPLCMIFEFMELGDLNDFLRKHSPNNWEGSSLSRSGNLKPGEAGLMTQQLVFISVDIATGLEYLTQNHYVHRDLATRNCLVNSEFRVKISDFGLSQDIYSTDYFRLGDSELLPIRWMPPEAILYAKFTTQSDVWSYGIVLWEIFSFGVQPYFSLTNEEVVAHVRDGNVLNCPEKCPQEIYDLMLDCWAMNPTERPTAAELRMGLGRWSPNLSATLAQQQAKPDYQNMATVREYAATQLSANSTSGRALNVSSSGIAAVEGQFEMAPAIMNPPNGIDAGVHVAGGQFEMAPAIVNPNELDAGVHTARGQFQMAPVVAMIPPGSTAAVGDGQPTVAYSSCVGKEEGSTPQTPNDQQEELTLL